LKILKIMELSTKKINYSWLFLISLFLLIWPMFIGPFIAIKNPSFFGGSGITEFTLSLALYVARNLAVGIAFLIAIYLRNAPILFILILIRFITDLIDAPMFYIFKDSDLVGLILIFMVCCYLPAIFGLRYLWKEMNVRNS